MNQGQREGEPKGPVLPRRLFLTGAAASAALVVAGCSSSSGGSSAVRSTPSLTTTTLHGAKFHADPFTLGVASGDPLTDRVILWTRLAPDPVADDGAGGMEADPVDVVWEVATDDRFTKIASTGVFVASADHAHSVHVDAKGLEPGTDYRYRFRVGTWTSPVGRTRTLADGSPDRFSLAVVNCQWYETGSYAAFRQLAQEDVDLVVHLGDYIYEFGGGLGALDPSRVSAPKRGVKTLEDYRIRYASYKKDPDLRATHQRFPFYAMWDDHDVANNYMGDTDPGGEPAAAVQARKAAGYQAWWEHIPMRVPAPTSSQADIYRSLDVGDLARLYLLDERQYAAVPPCRSDTNGALDYGDCSDRTAQDRERLGHDQDTWLEGALAEGKVTWNLLGSPDVMAGVDGGTGSGPDAYYLDTWDGYPDARKRFIAELADVKNPVVLTGDYHAGMVLDVHATPFDQSTPIVATEFMSPPISSPLFGADVSARTPQLRQQINAHGYLTVEVTPDKLTSRFRIVDDVKKASSGIKTQATWTVEAGNPVAKQA